MIVIGLLVISRKLNALTVVLRGVALRSRIFGSHSPLMRKLLASLPVIMDFVVMPENVGCGMLLSSITSNAGVPFVQAAEKSKAIAAKIYL